jgi:membrane-bound lytic murein transglycosylase MltF
MHLARMQCGRGKCYVAPARPLLGDAEFDELNRHAFAFAACNAGPARIEDLRTIAANEGLDPNEWFNNVEIVAGRKIGRETVDYVRNILKYWVAYHLALDPDEHVQRPAA